MRNFLSFIRRFSNLILFLTLEVVCMVLIARTETVQGNDIASSANAVTGMVYKKHSDILDYFGLRVMNDSLLNENARLRQMLDKYHSIDPVRDSFVHRSWAGSDTTKRIVKYADYLYHTARVINNSTGFPDNYITLNRGARDGISKNMAVISGSGIVGRVEHVSAHYATVLSILSSKQKVAAKLKDGLTGYIIWDEKSPDILLLTDIPQQSKVAVGDSVFTSEYSIFSPDILIGTVVKIELVKKNAMMLVYLRSSTNFRNLQYVYVIENKMAGEKKQLEDSTIKAKK